MNRERSLQCGVLVVLSLFLLKGIAVLKHGNLRFALVAASSAGDTATVTRLLSQGVSPNSEHLEGSSALWWAVFGGHLTTVQTLLSQGANPNSRGQYNSVIEESLTQFHNAEGTTQEPAARAIVRSLVSSGADIASIHDADNLRLLGRILSRAELDAYKARTRPDGENPKGRSRKQGGNL